MVLLGVLLGAGTYAAYIPKPVLAGILITVGIGILDYRGLRHLNKVPRGDAAVMLIVLLVTVFFDLLVAVGIGVAIAFLLFLNRRSQVKTTDGAEQKQRSAFETEQQADERIPPEIEQDVLVQRITGPLFFGFAATFRQHLQQQPEVRFLILRFLRVPFADQTGVYAFDETVRLLKERGTTVLITGLQEQPGELLRRLRIVPLRVPEEHTFATFDETIAFVQQQRLQHVN
jgi:SulP family sulfate permease